MATNPTPQTPTTSNPSIHTELIEALANVSLFKSQEHFRVDLRNYIATPYDQKTPKEKVKQRPDGYDYVESSYMDFETKNFMPLYKYELISERIHLGHIIIYVSLKDRITGNTELGSGAARIQVSRGVEEPAFRDVLDMGNASKSALTNAIKNAQSRFGTAADVYRKRESVPTNEERERFESMRKQIYNINATRAKQFAEKWALLGTDWLDFLDAWQVYVDRNQVTEEKKEKHE
jgi:hypothetical protein